MALTPHGNTTSLLSRTKTAESQSSISQNTLKHSNQSITFTHPTRPLVLELSLPPSINAQLPWLPTTKWTQLQLKTQTPNQFLRMLSLPMLALRLLKPSLLPSNLRPPMLALRLLKPSLLPINLRLPMRTLSLLKLDQLLEMMRRPLRRYLRERYIMIGA